MNPGALGLIAESFRKLETLSLTTVNGQLLSLRLPLDTVIRYLVLRLNGYITYTFSSAVSATETGIFDDICPSVEVNANGQTIKSIRPHMNQMHWLLATKVAPVRRSSTAATAGALPYQYNPTADAALVFGATTESSAILETLMIPFENILVSVGQEQTWLDTRKYSSVELRLNTIALSNLDRAGNATITVQALTIEPSIIECKDFPMEAGHRHFRQTFKNQVFASASTETWVQLNVGHRCLGVSFMVQQDYAGADGTAAYRKKPVNNAVYDMAFRVAGREIWSGTFQSLQDSMRIRSGVNAAFASNLSRLDGFARADFTTRGVLGTELDLRDAKSFEVKLTCRANTAAVNVLPVQVSIEQQEYVEYK